MDAKEKIVVVDDDMPIRNLFTKVLMFGMKKEVLTFKNGFMAWRYLKTPESADIIISDVNMPEMNGFELLDKIKNKYPKKRCIIMSADHANEITAKKLGADAFLAKPFRMNDLLNILREFGGRLN